MMYVAGQLLEPQTHRIQELESGVVVKHTLCLSSCAANRSEVLVVLVVAKHET